MSTTAAQTCALQSAHRHRDAELAERVGAGDLAAFAVLDERHRAALVRYAASLLRRSEHDAEDVVQEVLIGLYVALRAGDVPDDLRTWLFRLTHNRAINVVRRARWGDAPLDPQTFAERAGGDEPYAALRRSESLQELLGDLADLPARQRAALVARELHGHAAEQVAEQLDVSVGAAQMLAVRARENLLKLRAAREAQCGDIRTVLRDARRRGARPTEHALRHVKGCTPCSAAHRDGRRAPAPSPAARLAGRDAPAPGRTTDGDVLAVAA